MWKLHRQNRSRPQGRMPNEALMCPKGQSSEKYAARWASKRYDRMADWGFRSPSVHKSVPGVAETPHTRSQDDYGQLGRYPLDKPQGSIAPFTGYHPISLLFIYEFVDWWDGMSCTVFTCLVQWFLCGCAGLGRLSRDVVVTRFGVKLKKFISFCKIMCFY